MINNSKVQKEKQTHSHIYTDSSIVRKNIVCPVKFNLNFDKNETKLRKLKKKKIILKEDVQM